MGNDGGSIPKRRELVKEAARAPTASQLKESITEQQSHNWTNCPLSNKPLLPPIVSDCLGRLFNKDAVIEYLLPLIDTDDESRMLKAEADKIVDGKIKSLRDVVEVIFEQDVDSRKPGVFVCPITNKALGPGGAKAVYLVPCGHAFSAQAIKELSDEKKCQQCATDYEADDVIPILPTTEEDIKRLEARVERLKEQGLTHSLKKSSKKKRKNGEAETENGKSKKNSSNGASKASGIKNAATASLTAKVLDEQETRNKKRKLENNENLNSLFSSRDHSKKISTTNDFMTRGFAIPNKDKS